ncbi:hypothetical protein KI387_007954, partial [Taxus chinensis]
YEALVTEAKEAARRAEFIFDNCQDFEQVVNVHAANDKAELKQIQANMKNNRAEWEKVLDEVEQKRNWITTLKAALRDRLKELFPLVTRRMDALDDVASQLEKMIMELKGKIDELTPAKVPDIIDVVLVKATKELE